MLEFVLTVLVLELTPGPNMAYLATLAIDRGRRAGLLATAGVAAGLSVHAIVAALGLGVLISQSPLLYDLLRWTGVAYLLWRGFFSNLFNPKSILFFISVVPGFIRYDPNGAGLLAQAARLGATYIAIATIIHMSIVLLASQLNALLIAESNQKPVRRILAVTLALVAAWLAWTTRRM